MTDFSLTDTNDRIAKASTFIDNLKKGMNSAILGQEELINKILKQDFIKITTVRIY